MKKTLDQLMNEISLLGNSNMDGKTDLQTIENYIRDLSENEKREFYNKYFATILSPDLKKESDKILDFREYTLIPSLSIWTPSGYVNKKIYVQNDSDKYVREREDDEDEIGYVEGHLFSFYESANSKGVRLLTSSEWYQSREYFRKAGLSEIYESFGSGKYALNRVMMNITSTIVDFDRDIIIENPLINKSDFVLDKNGIIIGSRVYKVNTPKIFKYQRASGYGSESGYLENEMFNNFNEFFDTTMGKSGSRKSYSYIKVENFENKMKGIKVAVVGKVSEPSSYPGRGWDPVEIIKFVKPELYGREFGVAASGARYCYEPK